MILWPRNRLDVYLGTSATAPKITPPNAPRAQSQHPRARNDYDDEAAHESYMNPELGFQSGSGDYVDAD